MTDSALGLWLVWKEQYLAYIMATSCQKRLPDDKVTPLDVIQTIPYHQPASETLREALDRYSHLFEDFLLLDRGESLWEEREDASLEYERSDRSDLSERSERGDDDRPRLLLLRVGLGDPL